MRKEVSEKVSYDVGFYVPGLCDTSLPEARIGVLRSSVYVHSVLLGVCGGSNSTTWLIERVQAGNVARFEVQAPIFWRA